MRSLLAFVSHRHVVATRGSCPNSTRAGARRSPERAPRPSRFPRVQGPVSVSVLPSILRPCHHAGAVTAGRSRVQAAPPGAVCCCGAQPADAFVTTLIGKCAAQTGGDQIKTRAPVGWKTTLPSSCLAIFGFLWKQSLCPP